MKTHELAKALRTLASLLDKSPNILLEDVAITSKKESNQNSNQLALSINALLSLSQVGKPQLVSFINEMRYPIEVRPAYSARDVIGKLLSYLESNVAAQEQLKVKAASSKEAQSSPELMKALSSLLKGSI